MISSILPFQTKDGFSPRPSPLAQRLNCLIKPWLTVFTILTVTDLVREPLLLPAALLVVGDRAPFVRKLTLQGSQLPAAIARAHLSGRVLLAGTTLKLEVVSEWRSPVDVPLGGRRWVAQQMERKALMWEERESLIQLVLGTVPQQQGESGCEWQGTAAGKITLQRVPDGVDRALLCVCSCYQTLS